MATATVAPAQNRARAWPDERASGPFVIHSQFSLAQYGKLLKEIVELRDDIHATLRIKPSNQVVHVYLFRDRKSYQKYLKRYFPETPNRRAIFIKGQGPGMVFAYRSNNLATDLRHECTHAVLHASLPMIPLWLDEGLAEYFEMPADRRARMHTHLNRIRWNALWRWTPELERLEAIASLDKMQANDYRDAWAWTHFLLHGPLEARDELLKFLADIAARTPPGKMSARLSRRLGAPQAQLLEHFRKWR